MGDHVIAVRVDDIKYLVETARPGGTENTSARRRTHQRLQDAILAVSTKSSAPHDDEAAP